MPCEKYKDALIEAAVGGTALAPAVSEHVGSCAKCAAELEGQRSLIVAIDQGLHREMNAPVPAAVLQRLEAQVTQHKPVRALNLSWLYAAAALATATTMILFVMPRVRRHKSNSPTAALSQTVQSASEHRPQIVTLVLQPATPEEMRRDRKQHSRRAAPLEPEVLVPGDERIGLEQFIANLNGRTDLSAVIAKPLQQQPEQGVASLKTPDIETAALVVQPLQISSTE